MAAAVSAKAPGTRQHNSAPRPSPLTHNQPASQPAHLLEDLDQAVAGDGGADLLRAGRDGKGHLGLDARGQGLLGHRGGAHHVLVRGVGAGANQAGCRRGGRGGAGRKQRAGGEGKWATQCKVLSQLPVLQYIHHTSHMSAAPTSFSRPPHPRPPLLPAHPTPPGASPRGARCPQTGTAGLRGLG